MTLKHAKKILGPIRVFYSKKQRVWLLDQKPCQILDIIAAAEERLAQRSAAE